MYRIFIMQLQLVLNPIDVLNHNVELKSTISFIVNHTQLYRRCQGLHYIRVTIKLLNIILL